MPRRKVPKQTYAAAGVNLDSAARAKGLIFGHARSTLRPEVLTDLGFFGGLFEFKGFKHPVLVSSVDGVGTKLKVASALGKYNSVGIDLVNHCVNDIFTCGAEPLFFLDYIAMSKLLPERVEAIAEGIASACREVGCALIGGETAELPGVYSGNDSELVGFIIGVVEKGKVILGEEIKAGDIILGLPSSGLHTNGYSLVRRIFGETRESLDVYYPELERTLGEELLRTHRSYYRELKPHLEYVKGMAHITGGGLEGNVPRVLPPGLAARFDTGSWIIPPIFELIQRQGNIERAEMYRVFNMGIGMAVVSAPDDCNRLTKALPEAKVIGGVVKQEGKARIIIN